MTTAVAFTDCLQAHRVAIALLMSAGLGVPITYAWSEGWHYYLKKSRSSSAPSTKDRDKVIGISIGILERLFLTSLMIWFPAAGGAPAASWIIAKAAMGWDLTGNQAKSLDSRKRYSVHLMNSLVSIFWALAWGAWGAPPHPG